jgi:hypothetical protein
MASPLKGVEHSNWAESLPSNTNIRSGGPPGISLGRTGDPARKRQAERRGAALASSLDALDGRRKRRQPTWAGSVEERGTPQLEGVDRLEDELRVIWKP